MPAMARVIVSQWAIVAFVTCLWVDHDKNNWVGFSKPLDTYFALRAMAQFIYAIT